MTRTKALIALEDGTVFHGRAFAGQGEVEGELVFNTSMTGYQEILTDPSYKGQIVTLCYPLVGNYGINPEDMESYKPHAAGLVIGECSRIPSNWRSTIPLPQYLEENGIFGVDGVDTRAITMHIRDKGAMKCVISSTDLDPESLVAKAQASQGLVGRDLASEVSVKEKMIWEPQNQKQTLKRVATIDCGTKYNQLRILQNLGCEVHVFPNNTPAADILAIKPDGLFLSNGPGDPEGVKQTVSEIRKLLETGLPTFGICFGHQLTALALGAKTYKLKFGHRGGNQPVMNLATRAVEITSQNHGFCVDKDTLDPNLVETSHINLNDQTSEGLRHKKLPVFTVQYHPEAAPGPHDSMYLFHDFMKSMGVN
ncbi:glutamine-hydrolyzing carbamoyl-phosphate synthase small subunit [Kiritimatiellaeota bacterium B1221]|nr:glutamine-hydrolyzing carbamoyl-phosphate synthase small subunit [Kiritimatiellaeota bacterium B1221]